MKLLKPHPIAAMFPRLSEKELHDLALSIEESGLKDPIVLHEGKILDGINRQQACLQAKREPAYVDWDGKGTLLEFVLAKNLYRRHLNESQRALVAATALAHLEKEAKALAKTQAHAPRGRAKGRVVDAVGAAAKVSGRTVSRAKTLLETAPAEEIQAIRDGDKTLKQVERELKRTEQVEQARVYVPPAGEFEVITVDYSWKYDDELDGSDAVRGGCPYPPMSIEEICAFPIPAAKDCALFCWVTNSHLIDGSYDAVRVSLKERYGFTPKGIATWEKDKLRLGHYFRNKTEHLVLFVRGKPVFTDAKPWSHFRAPVGEHSEKPEAAYLAIEKFCASTSRLEMFARAPRPGWVTSGSELQTVNLDSEASRLGAHVLGSMKTEVVPVPAENLGDLTGTKFGEQLAKHAAKSAKKQRRLYIVDLTGAA